MTRNYSPWQWFVHTMQEAGVDGSPDLPKSAGPQGSADLAAWQRQARRKLVKALGTLPDPVPLNLEILESVDCGTYERQHIVYDTERWMSVPAYLLIPHARTASGRPGPAVLAQHGHGPGKAEVCGLSGPDGSGNLNDYAHQFALRGYVVLAPDLRTFGERADWEPPNMYSCDHTYMYAALLGHQLLALDLWDLARGLDLLVAHPLVDKRRVGMVGLSQGGTCTLFMSAWDRRIKATVVSGYLNRWDTCTTIGWNMCGSQVLSGITRELGHQDLGALIAPRPLLVETGMHDRIFPVDAARSTVDGLRQVYGAAGAADHIQHDVYDGGHKWHGDVAYPFLARWLGGDEAPNQP